MEKPASSVATRSSDITQRSTRTTLWLYRRVISPVIHSAGMGGGISSCRYLPTCSEYAEIAIHRFGPIRGTWMALRRLARCHPFTKGGIDNVPEN